MSKSNNSRRSNQKERMRRVGEDKTRLDKYKHLLYDEDVYDSDEFHESLTAKSKKYKVKLNPNKLQIKEHNMSANSLSELRKSRGNFDTLLKQVEKMSTTTTESNDTGKEWKLSVDKAGNGSAVIRFLPPSKGEESYWVRLWTHGFQGPTGKWYIENSLTTLNQPDPVSELNTQLWNTGADADKETARKQKRVFLITLTFLL